MRFNFLSVRRPAGLFAVACAAALATIGASREAHAQFVASQCGSPPNENYQPQRAYLVDPTTNNWDCNANMSPIRIPNFNTALYCIRQFHTGDAVYLSTGTYDPLTIGWINVGHPVVIAPYQGANVQIRRPTTDGDGQITVIHSSDIIVKNFTIANSGVGTGEKGIVVTSGTVTAADPPTLRVTIFNNTLKNISRHAIMVDGTDILVKRNWVENAAKYQASHGGGFWDGGISSPHTPPVATKCVTYTENTVKDIGGECVDVLRVLNASVTKNAISGCRSAHLYLDSSAQVTISSNFIFTEPNKEQWENDGTFRFREMAIYVGREYSDDNSYQPGDLLISNNIIDSVGQGVRFGNYKTPPGGYHIGYWNWKIVNNTILNTDLSGIKIDAPTWAPQGGNLIANNIIRQAPTNAGKGITDVFIDNRVISRDRKDANGNPLVIGTIDVDAIWSTRYNSFVTSPPSYPRNTTNFRDDPQLQGNRSQSASYALACSMNPAPQPCPKAGNPRAVWHRSQQFVNQVFEDFFGRRRSGTPSIGADDGPATAPPWN